MRSNSLKTHQNLVSFLLTHIGQSLYIHMLWQNETECEITIPREKLASKATNDYILCEYNSADGYFIHDSAYPEGYEEFFPK